jgi:hypothetical protein
MIEVKTGNFAAAKAAFREAAEIFQADNDLSGLVIIGSDCAELAAAQGHLERQATLVGFADAQSQRAGTGILKEISRQDGRSVAKDISPEFRTAFDRGRAMSVEDGIAYALSEDA